MNIVNISPYAAPGIKRDTSDLPFLKTKENIISLTCEITGISQEQIFGPRGSDLICNARFMVCHFLFTYLHFNKKEIGRLLNRDHTTIINAIQKYKNFYETEPLFRETADNIIHIIENKSDEI